MMMDSLSAIRSLVDATLLEYAAASTPMTDPEVSKLYGTNRGHVNKHLYARGYTAYKYRQSSKGGEYFTRSFYHPKGHRIDVRFDGDEVVRKATGTYGPKESMTEDHETHATLTHIDNYGRQKWEDPNYEKSDRKRYIWIDTKMSHKDAKIGSKAKLAFFSGTSKTDSSGRPVAGGHLSGWRVKELV